MNQGHADRALTEFRALIPARSGSKAIKNKNLSRYAGFTLLEYSIAAARLLLPVEDVWVSTDSEEYAEVAVLAGASVKFLRPAEFAQDHSTDLEVFSHAIQYEGNHESKTALYWLHLRPTTPLRNPEVLRRAIECFLAHPGNPSALRSAHESRFQVMKWCLEGEYGFLTGLNGDSNLDAINGPRQKYSPVLIPNGYIDIIRAENIRKGILHGSRCLGFLTPLVSDIDSIDDMRRLEAAGNRAPELEAWLTSHYDSDPKSR